MLHFSNSFVLLGLDCIWSTIKNKEEFKAKKSKPFLTKDAQNKKYSEN